MLLMTAFQFSNPVTVLVGVKGDDFLFDHRRRVERSVYTAVKTALPVWT